MVILNQQAELFMCAAACLMVGVACLYFALGFYGMLLDRALRWFGVHAAISEYIYKNRKRWYCRVGTWYSRTFQGGE